MPENTSSLPILPSIVFDGVPPPLRRRAAAATAAAPIHRFTVVFTQRRSSPTLQLSAIFPCTTMRADSSNRALRLLSTLPSAPRSSSSVCLLVFVSSALWIFYLPRDIHSNHSFATRHSFCVFGLTERHENRERRRKRASRVDDAISRPFFSQRSRGRTFGVTSAHGVDVATRTECEPRFLVGERTCARRYDQRSVVIRLNVS